jgi:hypothetical protein
MARGSFEHDGIFFLILGWHKRIQCVLDFKKTSKFQVIKVLKHLKVVEY